MNNFLSKKKVAYLTLGCKVNAYETEVVKKQFRAFGVTEVSFRESADIYIVNTCTVTNIADRKSRQMLRRAKKINPSSVVVALGCYVQEFYEQHRYDPEIDVLIGNRRKGETAGIVNRYFASIANNEAPECVFVTEDKDLTLYEELPPIVQLESCRAFLKVQDGCNQFCSYCIIPFARGRISSRSAESVCNEVIGLTVAGYQEVVLTGIHLSSYGLETHSLAEQTSLSVPYGDLPLLSLLRSLQSIEGLARIRLGSLEPRIITEGFVSELAKLTKVCPHFHLSLQSGCNRTLGAMNRKYTAEMYAEACAVLRKYYTNPAITTDIIVGFPQETPEDFEESLEFARQIAFSQIHVFPFSRRKGTVADRMSGQVPEEEKHRRERAFLEVEEGLRMAYRKEWIGKETEVLFEECRSIDGENYFVGYSDRYIPYAIFSKTDLTNVICRVIGTKLASDGTLIAEFA